MLAMLSQPSLQVGPVRSAPDTPASDLEPEASARAAGKEEVCSGKDRWHYQWQLLPGVTGASVTLLLGIPA